MTTVKIDNDYLLDLLMDRVRYWTSDDDIIKLFEMYYSNLIDNDCFYGMEFDPRFIVDNDYINCTSVIDESDFDNYHITGKDDDRILAEFNGYYLVSAC